MAKFISVRGAKEHNLKNVDVDIPRNSFTVITGLSGSGKSSLAFDTIYAEGHRRYVESLSAYARQFLNIGSKPDVDRIDGLSPAIAIEQKTTSKNPRSTVGTITEIYDYMRLLYAQTGTPHCPVHDIEIEAQTVSQMVDAINAWPEGTRLQIIAPVIRGRKGEYKKDMLGWLKQGFSRVRIDGELYSIPDAPALEKNIKHDIEIIIDRLAAKPENQARLADSIETALKLSDGMVLVEPVAKKDDDTPLPEAQLFSEKYSCSICNHAIPSLEPRLFSFNSPHGACAECDGLGEVIYFDPDLIIPDHNKSIFDGAIKTWKEGGTSYYAKALASHYKFDLNIMYKALPQEIKEIILYGSGAEELPFVFEGGKANFQTTKTYEGIIPNLQRRWLESANPMAREDLNAYRASHPCPKCAGKRLNENALSVKVKGMNIYDVCSLSIKQSLVHHKELQTQLSGSRAIIAEPILKEVVARLSFLEHVGLQYLTLSRMAGTLSGGESQRIRLASQIGSGLTGVMYVLDEPSIGLHQRDNDRLLESLTKLRDLDNTILVVEHDEDAIRNADFIIDMGPGAGEHGGEIIAQGTLDDILKSEKSITAQFLNGKREIAIPAKRRKATKYITLEGANGNNLQNVTVKFPLSCMTCVSGVSGSGKSTLVMQTLTKAVARKLNNNKAVPAEHKAVKGLEHIDKIVNIDQSAIGRTPRSNPATYTGIMSPIREWFAKLPDAQQRGYKAGRFSFNVKGGRCEACQGDGLIRVEMHFLPDVFVPCDICKGARFNRETLEVKYKFKSIADVLDMTVEEACAFFKSVPIIHKRLQTLMDVGLSYIRLGQSATTLSGGEAQRIKLSKELSKRSTGKTLYILDEPTTGLHFADIEMLLKVLQRLVAEGNTMIIIEHNLDVIKTADHIIDVGPEGGDGGGEIVATGTPEAVAKVKGSHTGFYLNQLFQAKKNA
ncbi:MAG: excinuclease ABC subunit A [Alphaproteobacteria bacterium]